MLCAWSTNITFLIVSSIIQALGACSGIVVSAAIVRDKFPDPKDMSKILSIMVSVAMVAPMLAPMLGSYLLVHLGWESNFYFLAIYGFILFLSAFLVTETYPESIRKPLPIERLFHAYMEQLKFPPFLLSGIAVSANFCVMFAFIASSSFIYIRIYHLPPEFFGYLFAMNAFALISGSLSSNKLKKKLEEHKLVSAANLCCFAGAIAMLFTIKFNPLSLWSVAIPSFVVTYGVGILYSMLMSYGLKNVVTYTGLTSSLLGTMRFVSASIVSLFMGFSITKTAYPLAWVMLFLSIITALCMRVYCTRESS